MKVVCDGLDLSIATAQVIKAISTKTKIVTYFANM